MTLAEYADHICAKVGKSDAESIELAKRFVRQRWKMIWDSALWAESKALGTFALDAGQTTFLAPEGLERILAVRWDTNRTLGVINPETVFDFDAELWDRTGEPSRFLLLQPALLGPTSSGADANVRLFGFDDDAATAGKKVKIIGENAAGTVNEYSTTVPLTASGGVVQGFGTSDTWVLSVTKETTAGVIHVTLNDGVDGAVILTGTETEAVRRPRIRVLETPTQTKSLLILGKRRANLLLEDQDAPLLQNVDNALIAFAMSDMLERMRQYAKAQLKVQEAQAQMQILRDLERGQQANHVQLIPDVEPDAWNQRRGFSGKGYW